MSHALSSSEDRKLPPSDRNGREMTTAEALAKSADRLRRLSEEHCRLVARLAGVEGGGEPSDETDVLPDCLHERRMKSVLVEVIAVLEETRRAFRSKRLETLRKRLIGVLAESD